MIWPSSSCACDLHLWSTVVITIVTGATPWSSSYHRCRLRHLLLLRLSLPLSDKVKQLQGVCISYNTVTTIYGSCQLPITSLQNMIISYNKIQHHALTISHHNMPCKNKLDVLYFVVASFTWLLRASSKNSSYLRIKTTMIFRQF